MLVVAAVVFLKEPEDEAKRPLNCSDLYIFSPDEMAKATDSFTNSNLIGEGTLGMMVMTTWFIELISEIEVELMKQRKLFRENVRWNNAKWNESSNQET